MLYETRQRNLYLSLLSLCLWWSVYTVFVFKAQIARLLEQRDAAKAAASRPLSSAAASGPSVSKGAVRVATPPEPSAPSPDNAKLD